MMLDESKTEFHKRDKRRARGMGPFGLFFYQLGNTTRHSFAGFKYLFRAELAAKIEAILFSLILVLYFALGVPLSAYLISTILFLLLIAFEALNTAIEVIIDHISPEISRVGKHAKDLGASAVVCTLAANAIFFFWTLVQIILF